MKPWQYNTTLTLSILCFVCTAVWMGMTFVSQSKLAEVQQKQNVLRQHQILQQITGGVVQQLAQLSIKNDNIRQFLTKHDITITLTPRPGDTGTQPERRP